MELTLMLMYLTSWEETPTCGLRRKPVSCSPEEMVRRCWKGYDHGVLDKLEEQGLIADAQSRAPMYITEDGENQALHLLKEYGIVTDIR